MCALFHVQTEQYCSPWLCLSLEYQCSLLSPTDISAGTQEQPAAAAAAAAAAATAAATAAAEARAKADLWAQLNLIKAAAAATAIAAPATQQMPKQ